MGVIETLMSALETGTGIPFADTAWDTAPEGDYGVVQIDFGGASLWGSGARLGQVLHGSVDVFVVPTGSIYTVMAAVEAALAATEALAWRFESKQFERDTKLTHLEWVFESTDVMTSGD